MPVRTIIEPFKIKTVEPIRWTIENKSADCADDAEERRKVLLNFGAPSLEYKRFVHSKRCAELTDSADHKDPDC
jgi:general stress protein 26